MPIYYRLDQRGDEWHKRRLGVPCSSEFHRILTSGGKPSTQAEDYAHRLIAEQMLGRQIGDDIQSQYMIRGVEIEDAALDSFEYQMSVETSPGGFVTSDDGSIGCSPDRLIGDDGILEMKCPAANTMVRYLLDPNSMEFAKKPQIMGQMLICERAYVDLVSYHPEMPLIVRRVKRDEPYIDTLRVALNEFVKQLRLIRERLERQYGKFKEITFEPPQPPVEDALGVSDEDVEAIWQASQRRRD